MSAYACPCPRPEMRGQDDPSQNGISAPAVMVGAFLLVRIRWVVFRVDLMTIVSPAPLCAARCSHPAGCVRCRVRPNGRGSLAARNPTRCWRIRRRRSGVRCRLR